jgi:hypothetical protein
MLGKTVYIKRSLGFWSHGEVHLVPFKPIAVTAASFCSYTIAARLRGVSASAAREDQVKTEEHAFVIGLEMRERRASR